VGAALAGSVVLVAFGAALATVSPRVWGPRVFGDPAKSEVAFTLERSEGFATTIDDGPDPVGTPAILAALGAKEAPATFFLIGARAARHRALVEDIVEAGHGLGNHDWVDRRTVRVPAPELATDLERTDHVLEQHGQVAFFRPRGGWFDDAVLSAARERGLRTVLGDVYPFDAALPFEDLHVWYAARHVHAGSILILHDGPHRGPRTARTLRRLIPRLRARGLAPVVLAEHLQHR